MRFLRAYGASRTGMVRTRRFTVIRITTPALRPIVSKALIEILDDAFRLVQPFDIVIALVDARKTGTDLFNR